MAQRGADATAGATSQGAGRAQAGDPQELMARFEYVQQALQQADSQLARLEQNSFDLRRAMSTLEALGPGQHETLVPIGGGLHLRARIDADQPVVLPVGRGYAVDHDVAGAKADLAKRIEAADAALETKNQEAERLAATARQLAQHLQSLES